MANAADLIELFHGSTERISDVRDDGVFGGVFCGTSESVALSHGPYLHRVELPGPSIASSFDLGQADYAAILAALIAHSGAGASDDTTLDALYDCVTDDKEPGQSLWAALGAEDQATASWKTQRLRGKVAGALGYSAVEMSDEHGTSYLVLPGAKIEFLGKR